MITFKTGDIFESQADAYVNAVNTVGVMGKGLAYQFKVKYPGNNRGYEAACKNGDLSPGGIYVGHFFNEPIIVNIATKRDWREPSQILYVKKGIRALRKWLNEHPEVKSIAIPALGCGNGMLSWNDVKPLIQTYLGDCEDVQIIVYEPAESVKQNAKAPKVGIVTLILLEMYENLSVPSTKNLKMAVTFLNGECGKIVICHEQFSDECKAVADYKQFYGYDNQQAIRNLRKQITSKTVDAKLKELKPFMDSACKKANEEIKREANIKKARAFLADLIADLEAGRILVSDIGEENIKKLMELC